METANKRWDKFRATAEHAQVEGMFEFAESSWLSALEEAEDFGDTDRRLAYTLEKLAECLWHQGKLTDAASHCKRVLKIYEKVLGKDHMDVACFAGNLAMIYHSRKEYDKAETYYKKALKIKKKELDPDNPDLKKLMGNYADLLQVTDRDDEARKLKTGAAVVTASDWRKGTSAHPAVTPASTSNNGDNGPAPGLGLQEPKTLGSQVQRRTPTKETMLPEDSHYDLPAQSPKLAPPSAAPSQDKPQPPKLPIPPAKISQQKQMAMPDGFEFGKTSLKNEANTPPASGQEPPRNTGEMSRPAAAQAPVQQNGAKATSPPEPPNDFDLWKEHKEAAERSIQENDLISADKSWMAALEVAERIGEDKPPLSYTLSSIGEIKVRQELYDAAIPCFQRSYDIKKNVLGDKHIAVAQSANALARVHYHLRDYHRAEPLAEECVRIYESQLGEEHQDVACALHNLATLFHVQRKYAEAEPAYKKALAIKTKVLGSDHPDTARLLRSYADLLRSTHREAEADHLDTCATGMITGSWKAIDIGEAESLLSRDDRCDICNANLEGEPKCPSCGFEAAIGVI